MLIKSNYIKDAYASLRDLVNFYSPRVNSHLYYYFAHGLKRVAIVNSRGYYCVQCSGWLPDTFEVDLLPDNVKSRFYLQEWKTVYKSKSLSDSYRYWLKCVDKLRFIEFSVLDDVKSSNELSLSSDNQESTD